VGNALLVFLVHLSIEQSISEAQTQNNWPHCTFLHEYLEIRVGEKLGVLGRCCGWAASSPGAGTSPRSWLLGQARWADQRLCLPAVRVKTGVRGLGIALAGPPTLSCGLSPRLPQGGDPHHTIPAGPLSLGATAAGWSRVLIGCGSPLDGGNGCTNVLKGHFSEILFCEQLPDLRVPQNLTCLHFLKRCCCCRPRAVGAVSRVVSCCILSCFCLHGRSIIF